MKLRPDQAIKPNGTLQLQASWCKGGRAREIPIVTDAQRELLHKAASLVARGASLIPQDKDYAAWLSTYKEATRNADLHKLHGLRHGYAQNRFFALAGFKAPAAGGPTRKELSPKQRDIDLRVRLQISQELGHNREEITAVYLGR